MSRDPADYRPAAGIMLVNDQGRVFVAQRLDSTYDAWQMPQGGLDDGETALQGALRELEEETGIAASLVGLVAEAPGELYYDLPSELQGRMWGGRFVGQRQRWFLMRFTGDDSAINLATAHPEFSRYQWVDPAQIVDLIVPFKRELYQSVLDSFSKHLPG